MNYSYKRCDRLAAVIQKEINVLLQRELYEFSSIFITITGVTVTHDLKNAKIYYSIFGNDELKKRTEKLFQDKVGRIRFELGKRIQAKSVPNLKFSYDDTINHASKIETILNDISNKKNKNKEE